jgi:hypothetical protein
MKKASSVIAICLAMSSGVAVRAEQPPSETRPSLIVIENIGDSPMACGLLFAHWYRQDFPVIAPGASVSLPLDLAPATQAVYMMNNVQHPMAVQDLFCARPGVEWSKVTHLDYRALSLKAVSKPLRIRCAKNDAGISCEGLSF